MGQLHSLSDQMPPRLSTSADWSHEPSSSGLIWVVCGMRQAFWLTGCYLDNLAKPCDKLMLQKLSARSISIRGALRQTWHDGFSFHPLRLCLVALVKPTTARQTAFLMRTPLIVGGVVLAA